MATGAALLVAALLAPVASSAGPAQAAPLRRPLAQISGRLSAPGYMVIALAADGRAATARARAGKFSIRPPAGTVTLQLRSHDGTYAGPIVIGRRGKHAILGVEAGANLGLIDVRASEGYANLDTRLAKRWVDPSRWSRAKNGVPIGAGNFGYVRSRHTHGGVSGDFDLDGVPDVIDVDDNGNLVLDDMDAATVARATHVPLAADSNEFQNHFVLPLPMEWTANADAGSTPSEIAAALPNWAYLVAGILPGDSSELDCGGTPDPADPSGWLGGLSYCTRGGTGEVFRAGPGGRGTWPSFPDAYDPDGDGFGTLFNNSPFDPPGYLLLSPGATSDQIGTGDILIQRVTTDGVETPYVSALGYIFATSPALSSYSDTAGDGTAVSYPVAPGGTGTLGNGFPVAAGADGHVHLTVTLWRPQRTPIGDESAAWVDMGNLTYFVKVMRVGTTDVGNSSAFCQQNDYSTDDPALAPAENLAFSGGFTDTSADQSANSANRLTYTVDLSTCLQRLGLTWNSGDDLSLTLQATDVLVASDAEQGVSFKLG